MVSEIEEWDVENGQILWRSIDCLSFGAHGTYWESDKIFEKCSLALERKYQQLEMFCYRIIAISFQIFTLQSSAPCRDLKQALKC